MATEAMREIVVEATLDQPYDGAVRLLDDAQRFGFELRNMKITAQAGGAASLTLALGIAASVDPQQVAARLARHPVVRWLDVRPAARSARDCPQAAA